MKAFNKVAVFGVAAASALFFGAAQAQFFGGDNQSGYGSSYGSGDGSGRGAGTGSGTGDFEMSVRGAGNANMEQTREFQGRGNSYFGGYGAPAYPQYGPYGAPYGYGYPAPMMAPPAAQ